MTESSPHQTLISYFWNSIQPKLEILAGTAGGSIAGVITWQNSAITILQTLIIALVTGFLGAWGAHLFKTIHAKLTKK